MSTLKVNSILDTSGNATVTGTVLQTVFHDFEDATSSTTTQSYVDVTNGSSSITSIGANSKFLITVSASVYQAAGNGINLGINRTLGGTTTRLLGVEGNKDAWLGHGNGPGATNNSSGSITRFYLDQPSQSSGTTITYKMLLGRWTAGTAYINYSGYECKSFIIIQEIAA